MSQGVDLSKLPLATQSFHPAISADVQTVLTTYRFGLLQAGASLNRRMRAVSIC